VADPCKQTPSTYVLPRQIWSFCVKVDVLINRREPHQLGRGAWDPPLSLEAWLTPTETRPSPHGLRCRISSLLVKRYRRMRGDPRENWPFKVIQCHRSWHWSIRYLWLPINVPYFPRPILYRFQYTAIYWPKKLHFFLISSLFNAPAVGVPLNLCNGSGTTVEWWGYLAQKKVW